MKAQISTVEMIISVIILFIAFNILFPGFSFKSRWGEASLLVKGRDILLTMDRTNKLLEYSFNTTSLQNFVNRAFPANDTIIWTSVDDTIKGKLVIACNCTNDQISNLAYWLKDLKFNNRSVDSHICYTNLEEKINPCFAKLDYPDILVIWGYHRDLSQERYLKLMRGFLENGNGIVEIADLPTTDAMQKQIFGITLCSDITPSCDWEPVITDSFHKPINTTMLTYQPYKYFYRIPFPAKAPELTGSIPVEGISSCPAIQTRKGNFTFRENTTNFWICDANAVYFDTNNNNKADFIARPRSAFNLTDYNFYLNYIENSSILISFRETYNFTDFLKDGNTKVYPIDQNVDRIFLSMGNYSGTNNPIPVVILNGTVGRTAWIADFSRSGLPAVKDDHKQLLNSLLLSVSNKKAKELTFGSIEVGYATSYINAVNYDMFEIYKLNLGVGYPF